MNDESKLGVIQFSNPIQKQETKWIMHGSIFCIQDKKCCSKIFVRKVNYALSKTI